MFIYMYNINVKYRLDLENKFILNYNVEYNYNLYYEL